MKYDATKLPPITPAMEHLAKTTTWRLAQLRTAKQAGHFTDFGLSEAIRAADCTGVNLHTIAIIHERHAASYYGRPDYFLRTQIEYHGCEK